ncbi:DUF3095 domain-containing protein [Phormidesmis sp. 146-35]
MTTESFYADLPVLKNFVQVTNPRKFVPVPHDWLIVITDIIGSTEAIEQGQYKTVNLLGACSISAVLNVAETEIPFVFGGDGATILIPITLLSRVKRSLLATQNLAREEFSMNLRVGIVPVADVASLYPVKIAKLRVSPNYDQSVFMGGGLTYATELVKNPATASLYALAPDIAMPKADFTGLECRWQDIRSQHGETVSLLVQAKPSHYREIIEQIERIYGSDRANPISPDRLHLSFDSTALMRETKVRARQKNGWGKLCYLIKIQLENLLGWVLMKYKLKFAEMPWGNYRQIVTAATDYRKFDDILRMVISGNAQQRQQLTDYLERKARSSELVYGLHVSDRALLTCLVYERNGRQVHFVDGADGGYALAAKAMKAKVKAMSGS